MKFLLISCACLFGFTLFANTAIETHQVPARTVITGAVLLIDYAPGSQDRGTYTNTPCSVELTMPDDIGVDAMFVVFKIDDKIVAQEFAVREDRFGSRKITYFMGSSLEVQIFKTTLHPLLNESVQFVGYFDDNDMAHYCKPVDYKLIYLI